MEQAEKDAVVCGLCPRACRLRLGETGACRVRMNLGGKIRSVTYGRPCAVHVDPIEKKPLFHFLPGTAVLSLGTIGCNLRCLNCQNWEISQSGMADQPANELMPADVPALAARHETPSVAYTYTEPLMHYEYTRDCCEAVRAAGLRNVLVTAAYVNPGPAAAIARLIDAANVDIKSMSDDFYREICGAELAPVLRAVTVMKEEGVHLEITNLVIPTLNDSDDMLTRLSDWVVRNLGAETPVHFSRFFPQYRLVHLPPTPVETLRRAAAAAAAAGLRHVYIGNVSGDDGEEDTRCPQCDGVVIRRRRYRVERNRLAAGACPDCGRKVAGVWQ